MRFCAWLGSFSLSQTRSLSLPVDFTITKSYTSIRCRVFSMSFVSFAFENRFGVRKSLRSSAVNATVDFDLIFEFDAEIMDFRVICWFKPCSGHFSWYFQFETELKVMRPQSGTFFLDIFMIDDLSMILCETYGYGNGNGYEIEFFGYTCSLMRGANAFLPNDAHHTADKQNRNPIVLYSCSQRVEHSDVMWIQLFGSQKNRNNCYFYRW